MSRATLYDGTSAFPHDVTVTAQGTRLALRTRGGHELDVEAALLTRDGEAGDLRFARSDLPGWRLRFDAAPSPDVLALLPGAVRYGAWIDRFGLGKAALVCAGVAGALLFVGYSSPAWLAPHVPMSWERNLGASLVGDFGDNRCRDPGGQRALEALAERVSPGATRGSQAIAFAVLDIGMVNAAAVPGQNVVFFRGMLEEARSPEELAGVMAHEIAHVRRRHVTEALIRELGIGALIRLFAGGIGANAEQLVGLSFTREHEGEADADAIAMLKAANIDPRPTGALFRRLGGGGGGGKDEDRSVEFEVEWLDSHPNPRGRADRFEAAHRPGASYAPALSDEAARALRSACKAPAPLPNRNTGVPDPRS
jgi:Zn-dependent protease with chaperone function